MKIYKEHKNTTFLCIGILYLSISKTTNSICNYTNKNYFKNFTTSCSYTNTTEPYPAYTPTTMSQSRSEHLQDVFSVGIYSAKQLNITHGAMQAYKILYWYRQFNKQLNSENEFYLKRKVLIICHSVISLQSGLRCSRFKLSHISCFQDSF